MRFEWDEQKNLANQKKHGDIAFQVAALVFFDPAVVLRKERVVEGEQRWHAIGAASGSVLLVVHAYRGTRHNGEETIRIISAREANKHERGVYLEQAFD